MLNIEEISGSELRNYETIFIVDSLLEDDKVESITNKYINLLTKNDANIIKTENWGRKKFAYPIKKKQSGCYVSIEFAAPAGVISKLERAYHLDDNILRFLTIHYNKATYKLRQEHLEKKAAELTAREPETEIHSEEPEIDSLEEFPDLEEKIE